MRILKNLLGQFWIAYWLAVLELPGLGDFLFTVDTGLVLNDLSDLEVRVVLDDRVVRSVLRVLVRQLSLVIRGRTNLDDLLSWLADLFS